MSIETLVSIVVPAHNVDCEYLQECLASIASQSYTHWEAVVIDDGCEGDQLRATVDDFGDDRIRYHRHGWNRGVAAARNTGARIARGGFVLMVDSDDRLDPACISKALRALQDNSECVVAYPDYYLFGTREGLLRFTVYESTEEPRKWNLRDRLRSHFNAVHSRDCQKIVWEVPVGECEPALLLRFLLPPGAGTLFRRSFFERVEYCEADVLRKGFEDWDFWLSAAKSDTCVVHVPETLYYYRQHGDSLVNRLRSSDFQLRHFLYDRHHDLIDELHVRGAFLAQGYRRSAKAMWHNGKPIKALGLAARALKLDPHEFARALLRKRSQPGSTQHNFF